MLDKFSRKAILVAGLVVGYHVGRRYDVKFMMKKVGK